MFLQTKAINKTIRTIVVVKKITKHYKTKRKKTGKTQGCKLSVYKSSFDRQDNYLDH